VKFSIVGSDFYDCTSPQTCSPDVIISAREAASWFKNLFIVSPDRVRFTQNSEFLASQRELNARMNS